ncbi:MAG: hypothetical protein KIS62_15055 [Ramlibacter sp.]|nr:hypothetical protein [Ramlibacter sp.]
MPVLLAVGLATALACASIGGGLFQCLVVDPVWPSRPELIQPARGGLSCKRFWIPVHVAFEVALMTAIAVAWSLPNIRYWLLIALTSHATMRIWSALDFIPKALAFEQAEPGVVIESAARRWTRRSRWRLPLDLISCGAMWVAFTYGARLI